MKSDNPYQAPPHELGEPSSTSSELGYWPYAFIVFKFLGTLLVGMVLWFATSRHSAHSSSEALLLLWGLLAWTGFGAIAAVGVAFRLLLAKHVLVVHLTSTAGIELYAFASMMSMQAPGPLRELAFNYGWTYFLMAVWDLGWAALFQFSQALRRNLR